MTAPSMSVPDELDLLRHGDALVDRSDRGAVLVTGPDALSFLQALVSFDVDALADGDGAHCLLLTPQGKLDVDFRFLRVGDDAWLDTDPGLGEQLAASLNRFKIRVKADVVDRTDAFAVASVIGEHADRAFAGVEIPTARHAHVAAGDVAGDVQLVRTAFGVDVVGPHDAVAAVVARLEGAGWRRVGRAAGEAFRIEAGVAVQPLDVDDATIPQEAFLERDAVSFTKGCFLGQELVCRIDSRGHVNRFLRRFTAIEGEWPEPGAEVVVDGKVVGALTSVAPAELPTGALGYVRREVEPPAAVELRWPGGSATAQIVALDVAAEPAGS